MQYNKTKIAEETFRFTVEAATPQDAAIKLLPTHLEIALVIGTLIQIIALLALIFWTVPRIADIIEAGRKTDEMEERIEKLEEKLEEEKQ